MCGLTAPLRGVFKLFAMRVKEHPNEELLSRMVTKSHENLEGYEILREVLGLKNVDLVSLFPMKPDMILTKQLITQCKLIIVEFLSNYFEEVPKSYVGRITKRNFVEYVGAPDDGSKNNVIAPLLFCLDDLHNYDDLSFRMMKLILKQFSPVMCIGVIRDQYAEGPKPFADKN
jgi:adenylate cyclase 10